MDNIEKFFEVYQNLQWVFSLGYVTILSIVATIFLVKLEKATILKKMLSGATAMQKDSILGFAGTITSLIVFSLFHFGNEMIIQGKFLIDFDNVTQGISIPAGAAIVWSGSKGVYTVIHKWWQRVKSGEKINWLQAIKELVDEIKKKTSAVSETLPKKDKAKKNKAKAKAQRKRLITEKKVINRRTQDNGEV